LTSKATDLGHLVPLVDQDRPFTIEQALRIGGGDGALGGIVELVDGVRSPGGGRGLSDRLGTISVWTDPVFTALTLPFFLRRCC
jgi:hypothetical protein